MVSFVFNPLYARRLSGARNKGAQHRGGQFSTDSSSAGDLPAARRRSGVGALLGAVVGQRTHGLARQVKRIPALWFQPERATVCHVEARLGLRLIVYNFKPLFIRFPLHKRTVRDPVTEMSLERLGPSELSVVQACT